MFEDPKNYPTETLYFTIIAGDHQRYLGGSEQKRRLAAELYPCLGRAAVWFERQRGADFVLYQLPKETFIDWMPHDMRGASFTLNVLYARFLAVLGDLAESLEKPDEAASWRAQAARLREHLRASHWDDRRGLFVDSVYQGERSRTVSELSNGMALVAGVADEEQTARIVAHMEQPPDDLLRTTPLILFVVLEGLAAAGRTDLAVRIMRERYAPMMAATDAPTMWESWSMFVRERGAMARAESRFTTEPQFASPNPYSGELTGLVHSSSVAPAWTLSRHVLGILPAAPGFARCRIAPPAVADLSWARGVLPSARGADRRALAASGRGPDPAGRPARRARDRGRAAPQRRRGPAADPRRQRERGPCRRRHGRWRRPVAGIAHPAAGRRRAPDRARPGVVNVRLL